MFIYEMEIAGTAEQALVEFLLSGPSRAGTSDWMCGPSMALRSGQAGTGMKHIGLCHARAWPKCRAVGGADGPRALYSSIFLYTSLSFLTDRQFLHVFVSYQS